MDDDSSSWRSNANYHQSHHQLLRRSRHLGSFPAWEPVRSTTTVSLPVGLLSSKRFFLWEVTVVLQYFPDSIFLILYLSVTLASIPVALTGGAAAALRPQSPVTFSPWFTKLRFHSYSLFLIKPHITSGVQPYPVPVSVQHISQCVKTLSVTLQVGRGLLFCFTIRRTGALLVCARLPRRLSVAGGELSSTARPTADCSAFAACTVRRYLQGPSWLTGGRAGPRAASCCALAVLFLCALLVHLRFPDAISRPLT